MNPKPPSVPKTIDWQEVRQRLARATAATTHALALSPEQAKAVMDQRARVLSRPPVEPHSATNPLEVVTFSLGNEEYALETRFVCEIVRVGNWTPVPGTPDFFIGITNLRGDFLALVDLCRYL